MMPRTRRIRVRRADSDDDKMDDTDGERDGGGSKWKRRCDPCISCCNSIWSWCWGKGGGGRRGRGNSKDVRKEDITYILQGPSEAEESDGSSEEEREMGERHGSFTSASLSMGSSHSAEATPRSSSSKKGGGGGGGGGGAGAAGGYQQSLKDAIYEKIEQNRRASGWSQMRKTSTLSSTAPFLDLKSWDFWSNFTGSSRSSTSEPQPVQPPQMLLSPGRRDTISSQGSADHIRPDLYETVSADSENVEMCPVGPLGALHFFLIYDIDPKLLNVKVIEAQGLPKPITLDPTKSDQSHSNPYVKLCLLPNQKDSRQTQLKKKTQSPRWDENFQFEIAFTELTKRTLKIIVKDFDKYSRHRIIGQILMPFEEDVNVIKGAHFWKQLEPAAPMPHDDLGEILFSLCFLPAAGRLNVDVLRAKQLVPTDLVGGSSPYVKVSVIANDRHIKTKKTSYKKSTHDPVFNESLSFDVNSVQLANCIVVLSILDFNGGVVKDNFIGRVVLGKENSGPHEVAHWKNMIHSHRTAIAQWHSLKSRENCDQNCPTSRTVP